MQARLRVDDHEITIMTKTGEVTLTRDEWDFANEFIDHVDECPLGTYAESDLDILSMMHPLQSIHGKDLVG